MLRLASGLLVLVVMLSIGGMPTSADDIPVTISPEAISSGPKAKLVDFPDGRMWQVAWARDPQERHFNLAVTKAFPGKVVANAVQPDTLHEISFHEGLTEDAAEADVRIDDRGEARLLAGSAIWLLGSELAERPPLSFDDYAATATSPGKAPRGPERRYCLSFSWLADDDTRALAGAYCKVVPAGETQDGSEMLSSLKLDFY